MIWPIRIIKHFEGDQDLKIQEALLTIAFNFVGFCIEGHFCKHLTKLRRDQSFSVFWCFINYHSQASANFELFELALNNFKLLEMRNYRKELQKFVGGSQKSTSF
ncbi:hypothetical protein [Xylocopilactobacillus apicola]|uniref:hypothetical protein n=1 Tax=Xylocopilactobacillus apicola TaxID=2932184 RepID=UPI002953FB42|nr:hypothetical protein [Xylocopilactobacillus apicola]